MLILNTDCIIPEENVAPLVLYEQQEGEDGGEEDQDDAHNYQQAAVKPPALTEAGLAGLLHDSIFQILITRGSCLY